MKEESDISPNNLDFLHLLESNGIDYKLHGSDLQSILFKNYMIIPYLRTISDEYFMPDVLVLDQQAKIYDRLIVSSIKPVMNYCYYYNGIINSEDKFKEEYENDKLFQQSLTCDSSAKISQFFGLFNEDYTEVLAKLKIYHRI